MFLADGVTSTTPADPDFDIAYVATSMGRRCGPGLPLPTGGATRRLCGLQRKPHADRARSYRIRLPGGGPSGTSISVRWSGPSPAARTIPSERTPKSFAGFRLATTATRRPAIASAV